MPDGRTLVDVMPVTAAGITADKLQVQADSSTFCRFDNFNGKYNIMGDKVRVLLHISVYVQSMFSCEVFAILTSKTIVNIMGRPEPAHGVPEDEQPPGRALLRRALQTGWLYIYWFLITYWVLHSFSVYIQSVLKCGVFAILTLVSKHRCSTSSTRRRLQSTACPCTQPPPRIGRASPPGSHSTASPTTATTAGSCRYV